VKAATYMQATIEELLEAVFSMLSASRLYKEDQLTLPVSVNRESREESSESAGKQLRVAEAGS
jgi:hypothetical protein